MPFLEMQVLGPTTFCNRHGMGATRHSPGLGYLGMPRTNVRDGRGCDTRTVLKCRAQLVFCWERKDAGVSPASLRLMELELATELRRRFLQCCDQLLGGRRHGFPLPLDDFLRIGRLPIELVIGFIVGPKR